MKVALQTYKTIKGDFVIARDFIIPSSRPWPKVTWLVIVIEIVIV